MSETPTHRVPEDVLAAHLDGEAVLLHMDTKNYYRLNATAAHVFRTVMEEQAPPIMRTSGGPTTLARLGVVEVGSVDYANSTIGAWGGPGRLWAMLNLETWARQRSQPTRSTGRSTR